MIGAVLFLCTGDKKMINFFRALMVLCFLVSIAANAMDKAGPRFNDSFNKEGYKAFTSEESFFSEEELQKLETLPLSASKPLHSWRG